MADTTTPRPGAADPWTTPSADERRRLNAAETDARLAAGEDELIARQDDAEAREARAGGDTARSPYYGDA